jgi:hypothetical protein
MCARVVFLFWFRKLCLLFVVIPDWRREKLVAARLAFATIGDAQQEQRHWTGQLVSSRHVDVRLDRCGESGQCRRSH